MKKMFWMLCLLSLHITAQTVGENGATDDYAYDASGNLIRDANKNITNITYNHLNLPVVITFSNGDKIVYLYNAVGEKRQKKVTVGDKTTVTDYLGGFQYEDGELKFFQHEEGYVAVTNSDSGMDFTYVYNYTDHLGNVRLSWAKDNTTDALKIIRESNYYPYGLEHKGYNTQKYAFIVPENGTSGIWTEQKKAIVNPYRYSYNGKEFQHELRLNLYDYGARNYDPAIGRWMNIDPLAEKSRRFSPYVYALDNPVYFIDPDGMQAISTSNIYDDRIQMTTAVGNEKYGENDDPGDKFVTLRDAAHDFGKLYNGFSIINKTELHTIFYKTKDSEGNPYYTYSVPSKGTNGSVSFDIVKSDIKSVMNDKNAEIMADGHTHGADRPVSIGGGKFTSDDNKFSDDDISIYKNTYTNSDGSIGNPYRKPVIGFLGTPNGGINEFDPNKNYGKSKPGEARPYNKPIFTDLPSDPNSKNLRLNTISPNVVPRILPK